MLRAGLILGDASSSRGSLKACLYEEPGVGVCKLGSSPSLSHRALGHIISTCPLIDLFTLKKGPSLVQRYISK